MTSKTVQVYSKNNCPACVILKHTLKSNGIEFEERNIDQDQTAKFFLLASGHRSVPQVYVDGEHVDQPASYFSKID